MSNDSKYKKESLQKRLDAIRNILNPDGEIPEYVLASLQLDYRRADPERRYSIEGDKHILEWSERGSFLKRKVYGSESEVAYSIVVQTIISMANHMSHIKQKGRATDEMLKEKYEYKCALMDKVNEQWAKKYREKSAEQLAETLQRRAKMRELDRNSAPER